MMKRKFLKIGIIFVIVMFLLSIIGTIVISFIDMGKVQQTTDSETQNQSAQQPSEDLNINIPSNLNIQLTGSTK